MPTPDVVPDPWSAFFSDLDSALTEAVSLHCMGGFVVSVCYQLNRPTADVDFAEVIPKDQGEVLLQLAGAGSKLHRKHGVYVEHVTVANLPDNYEDRLVELVRYAYRRIHLYALDAYDLALSKVDRNSQVDRDDVKHLVKTVPLDLEILKRRYEQELRPVFVGDVKRADLTMTLWLEAFSELP